MMGSGQWVDPIQGDLALILGRVAMQAARLASRSAPVIYCLRKCTERSHESFPHSGCIVLLTGPAYAQMQTPISTAVGCLPNAGGKGAGGGPAKGLQGIVEENTGCQGLFRSVGTVRSVDTPQGIGSSEAADQNRSTAN